MPTILVALLIIVFGFALRSRAAGPTTNPADLERDAVRRIRAVPLPAGVDDLAEAPLDPAVRAYLAACGPALEELATAARLPALPPAPVGDDLMPTLTGLNGPREAVGVLRLSARSETDAGRPDAAVERLLTGIAYARHVGRGKLMVHRLVEVGMESVCVDALAAILPSLPDASVAGLPARLSALPPAATLAVTLDAEQAFGRLMVRKQAGLPADAPADATLMTKAWEAAAPLYVAARQASDGTPAAYAAAVDVAAAKLLANPFARTLAPVLRLSRATLAVPQAKRAMLLAAVDARLHGRAVLDRSKDPFGTGPFQSTPTANGYQLASALRIGPMTSPVTLTVGRPERPAGITK